MIDYLQQIDQNIVLSINDWHSPLLDKIMWLISGKNTWIPLYLLLIYLGFNHFSIKQAFFFVGCVIVAVGCTDFICSGIIKNCVMRLRPSHHPMLSYLLHFHKFPDGSLYKGGQYGFVSSHAGNFFAIAWLSGWILRPYYPKILFYLLAIALVVVYSRIYLGVHYPSDIIGGFLVGTFVAMAIYKWIYCPISKRLIS